MLPRLGGKFRWVVNPSVSAIGVWSGYGQDEGPNEHPTTHTSSVTCNKVHRKCPDMGNLLDVYIARLLCGLVLCSK